MASSSCISHPLDGPACEKELWDVHVWTIRKLLGEDESAASNYVNNLSGGAFQDDFSGIGCPKIALQLLQDAMRRRGFPLPTPMTFMSESDIGPHCQATLSKLPEGMRGQHLFPNIMDRIAEPVRKRLDEIEARYLPGKVIKHEPEHQ